MREAARDAYAPRLPLLIFARTLNGLGKGGVAEVSYRFDPDALDEQAADENFIIRHWRGHLSLPASWFLVGVLLSTVLVAGLALAVAAIEASSTSLRVIAVAWVGFFVIFAVVRVWATVGIWRSAGLHEVRGGSPGWAYIARILVVVGVLGTLGQAKGYALQVAEYGQLAAGHDPLGESAAVTVEEKGQRLDIRGPLALGTADRVEEVAKSMPSLRTIGLESRGGRIFEATRLADFVRAHELQTSVPRLCESACTLVLLAGKDRTAGLDARIGFHQPDFPGMTADDRSSAVAANSKQYIDAGIDKDFVSRMMQTPPSSMWYPTHQELIQANVIDGDEGVVTPNSTAKDWLRDRLLWEAADLNRRAPITLDEITTLKSARAAGHEVFLSHALTKEVEVARTKAAKPSLTAIIRKGVCGDQRTRELIDAGAVFNYHYDQVNGRPLYDITISSCG